MQGRKATNESRGTPCEVLPVRGRKIRAGREGQILISPWYFKCAPIFFVKPFKSGFISPSLGDWTGCLIPSTEKKADMTPMTTETRH